MLQQINIPRPPYATRWRRATPSLIAVVALLACVAPLAQIAAAAQQDDDPPGEREREPDAGDVTRAWFTARAWLDAFSLPDPDEPDSRHKIDNASGVCIIIRRNGRVLGIGKDLTGHELMLRRAAGRAFGDVHSHEIVQRLTPSVRENLGQKLTLELEVAGPMQPLLGRTYRDVSQRLRPGLEGVAMRRRERSAARFPAEMLATNTARAIVDGQAGLPGLVIELGEPMRQLRELRRDRNVSVYRFETVTLAQRTPDATPFAPFRGDTLVSESHIDGQAIRALADGIAGHVLNHRWPGDEPHGLLGNYDPIADQHEPLIAAPMEQALGALALARYAGVSDPPLQHAEQAHASANQLLDDLAIVTEGEDDPLADPVTCAAIVCAAFEPTIAIDSQHTQTFVQRAREKVLKAFAHASQHDAPFPRSDNHADTTNGPPSAHNTNNASDSSENEQNEQQEEREPLAMDAHGRALLAWAIVRLAVDGKEKDVEVDEARAAIESVFEHVEPAHAVATLPWLGWAAMELAEHTGASIGAAHRLAELFEVLEAARLGRDAAPDLRGGFALTRGRADHRLADAQTLRPAAFVASAVDERTIMPDDQRLAALGRHLRTMRFLVQVQVSDDDIWRYPREAADARGGLRNATWDATQPVSAQALGLLTAVETLKSLENPDKNR